MNGSACPSCLNPHKFNYFERQMLSNSGGKPCKSCGMILKPSILEHVVMFLVISTIMLGLSYFSNKYSLWLAAIAVLPFGFISVCSVHMFIRLRAKEGQ